MRSLRRDKKGISPIIATILLIAVTVAAAGTIAVYVSGLYISSTRIVAGTASANIYDSDNTSGEEFKNENVLITFSTTTGNLRYVGDADRGLTITLSSPRRGWGPFVADTKGQTNYSAGSVSEQSSWSVASGVNIVYKVYVPVTSAGRLEEGAVGYLIVKSATLGYPAQTVDNAVKVASSTRVLWEDDDDWTVSVSSYGDSFTTQYGTVRLFGSNWIQT
ncbi:MAG: archaellin/type IV pilin N-terminal domain-containing protein [Candidatus Hadarchaeota archaeon]